MLDFFHLPDSSILSKTLFYPIGNSGGNQVWNKPRGAKLIHILCISGGSGGAGGLSAASGNQKNGGGGGASGMISTLIVPAILIPDTLYVRPSLGGAGGAGGTTPVAGGGSTNSFVLFPQPNLINILILAQVTLGGSVPTSTTGGTGGLSTAAVSSGGMIFANLGIFSSQASSAGGNGATNGAGSGTDITALSSLPIMGGAGGGSSSTGDTSTRGGNVNSAGLVVTVGASNQLNHGQQLWKPFVGTGGYGGISSGTGTGGNGGNGAIGCGGGGGGGGITGGAGGRGGDGMVLIVAI